MHRQIRRKLRQVEPLTYYLASSFLRVAEDSVRTSRAAIKALESAGIRVARRSLAKLGTAFGDDHYIHRKVFGLMMERKLEMVGQNRLKHTRALRAALVGTECVHLIEYGFVHFCFYIEF